MEITANKQFFPVVLFFIPYIIVLAFESGDEFKKDHLRKASQ